MPLESSLRSRMPLACAECRRLKLKCDKNKPCSSCVRRGCASICPQGRMVSKGSRFILANTEQLHDKIDTLIGRVRQLEGALELLQARHSQEPHALLGEELRLIATPVEAIPSESEPVGQEDDLTECMGTLALDGHGTRYYGSTGAFTFLWRDDGGADGDDYRSKGEVSLALADLPTEISQMAQFFPLRLPTFDASHLGTWILENCLPPFPVAWSLFESYWEHYSWHFTPITRHGFVEQIFSPLYHGTPKSSDKPLGHRLGLLFMVFAMGDLLDLTQPWVKSRGLRYYLLARASLCLDPVLESPTVTALQALHLINVFLLMSRGVQEPEHAWVLCGINIKLALTLGLQHDANKFNLSPEDVEDRQYVTVAAVATEIWQSLCVGRPPSHSFSNVDWVFPAYQHSDAEELKKSPRFWVASFIRDCTCQIVDAVVPKKPISYRAILQLDAKIREYPTLVEATTISPENIEEIGVGTIVQRTFMNLIKEVSLLFLHRRSFALALRDFPDDPLKSPLAPSVVACHNSAISFVSTVIALHSRVPALSLRIWFIWPNVFVATLVLGSIVARSPGSSLAPSALLCLERVCQLWETASDSVTGCGKVLEVVRELKRKAYMAFTQNKAPNHASGAAAGGVEITDEIHALGGGGPRIISSKPQLPVSSASSPYSTESPKIFSESSQSPPSSNPSDEFPPQNCDNPVDIRPSGPFAADSVANLFPSMPFDWETYDYSSHLLPPSDNTLPADFDGMFDAIDTTAPHDPLTGPTILEQLGLGGEWQPVMDHLGLS